uniref:Uncharacterized protein n=1 Tax=Oryza brachyantha TaxID=4533 RepID=J3LC85_ORYBR
MGDMNTDDQRRCYIIISGRITSALHETRTEIPCSGIHWLRDWGFGILAHGNQGKSTEEEQVRRGFGERTALRPPPKGGVIVCLHGIAADVEVRVAPWLYLLELNQLGTDLGGVQLECLFELFESCCIRDTISFTKRDTIKLKIDFTLHILITRKWALYQNMQNN